MNERPVLKMSALDRGIAALSPRWALNRMAAKSRLIQFGYNDDPLLRGQPKPVAQTAGETYAKQRDRYKMMADAREQAEFTWIGGVVGKLTNYVVGELVCKSSTGNPRQDAIQDKYLHDWAGDEEDQDGFPPCDTTGRHRLIKLGQIGVGAMTVDGEHGFQWIPGGKNRMPSLLSIDADRIGSPHEAVQSETYIGGIMLDPTNNGRITGYRIFKRSRLSQYTDPVEVPPSNFFHIWDTDRGDEYHGRSHLKRALNPLRDMHETENSESVAIKTQSQWAAMIGSKDPWTDKGIGAWNGKTTAGTPTQDAQWGKLLRLQEGESVQGFQPTARPTGSFMQFEEHRIRQVAAGLKLSFGFVWNMQELGGATARVEVKGDARQIAYLRRLLVDKFLRRVRKLLLAHGVAYGHIPPHPNSGSCKWHFGTDIIVDAGYEVTNDLQLLNAGLTDPDTLAVKYNNGEDFAGVQRHKAGAFNTTRNIAAETGTTIEILAGGLWPDGTNQIAARNTDPAELAPPPPGSLQAVGEKGAQQIADLLLAVAAGTLDRESCKQSLVTIYGLTDEQADDIVPTKVTKPKEPKMKPTKK